MHFNTFYGTYFVSSFLEIRKGVFSDHFLSSVFFHSILFYVFVVAGHALIVRLIVCCRLVSWFKTFTPPVPCICLHISYIRLTLEDEEFLLTRISIFFCEQCYFSCLDLNRTRIPSSTLKLQVISEIPLSRALLHLLLFWSDYLTSSELASYESWCDLSFDVKWQVVWEPFVSLTKLRFGVNLFA